MLSLFSGRLLHVGCGTSEVGPKLAAEAGLNLHVIDTDNSPSAVRLMQDRHQSLSCYACREMDALDLPFPDGRFGAVLDKGTLDALLCRSAEDAQALVMEMHRVLTDGGIYVQVGSGCTRRGKGEGTRGHGKKMGHACLIFSPYLCMTSTSSLAWL